MDRAHREELKHDKFVQQVGHTVEYAVAHRDMVTKAGGGLLLVAILGFGWYFYSQYQESVRQRELQAAYKVLEAPAGPVDPSQNPEIRFATPDEKAKAAEKALRDLSAKFPAKREGHIAKFLLATILADRGNVQEAEKLLRDVAGNGGEEYSAQAKLSLAQLLGSQNRIPDAEKLLRGLIDDPALMVSKEQATIMLARLLIKSKPEEARKLLEPLRGYERAVVSRTALTALSEMPPKK